MKILRAAKGGQAFYAVVTERSVRRIAGTPYGGITFTGEEYSEGELELLAPCEPSKIVAVGLNYFDHASEMKEAIRGVPVLFIKPASSVIAHGGAIVYPGASERVDYEAELAMVIGKRCKNVSKDNAKEYILGYTVLNDVTARDLQKKDQQWTRAKSFDTFCPMGPYIDTEYDPLNRRIQSVLNGEVKQDGNTTDMLFGPEELVSFISGCMTLMPGDVIATGTPAGIGPMKKGDVIEIRIEGLETLRNSVI